jgi:polar amino acid transport system substrate-binding protein
MKKMCPHNTGGLPTFCFFVLMLTAQNSMGDEVRISTFEQETAIIDVSTRVMAKIYQRLGHKMTLIRFPAKRSLVEANNGGVDGELIRVKGAASLLPNLERIPTEIGRLKAMALTLADQPAVVGMGGLIGKKVGIVRGVEFTDRLTQNLSRQVLNSLASLFQSLLKGRVDVIIFPELDALEYIKSHQLAGSVVINESPIIEVPLYHYIHKNKPALIQNMTVLLEQLKKSGELAAIINSAEQARH